MKRILSNNAGFSIIEVLIGATVFMVGFSALVLMLDRVFVKFSIRELELANIASQKVIAESVIQSDTVSYDSTIDCTGLKLRVRKDVTVQDALVGVKVTVSRASTGKKLIELYNEFIIAEE